MCTSKNQFLKNLCSGTHRGGFQFFLILIHLKNSRCFLIASFYLIIDVFYGRPQSNKSASFNYLWLILTEMERNCKIVCFSIRKNKSRLLFVSIHILNRDGNPQLCNLFIQILQAQLIISTFKNAFRWVMEIEKMRF